MFTPVSVIIITHNEEVNLPFALKSVCGWADQVLVVDSFSVDRTMEIAKSYGAEVYQNLFHGCAEQRNWALANLPLKNDWVFFLDADEYLSPELNKEIDRVLKGKLPNNVCGFFIKRRFYFLGRWIKHGDIYPSLIRLIRIGNAYFIKTEGHRERTVVEGDVLNLTHNIIHDDNKDIIQWITKQSKKAYIDATERLGGLRKNKTMADMIDSKRITIEELKQLRFRKIFLKIPARLRPFAQFTYRYIFRLGFLDGWPGFVYHFLLQFWYPLIVEAIYEELKYRQKLPDKDDVGW
jgi:glycosyltransferase involved in cell wall biosynthesis